MTDKDLIAKLNSLKTIRPESAWTTSNRDLLLSQISNSGARDLSAWKMFTININSFVKTISHPVYALGTFIIILIGGSIFSHQIFVNAKPNDSLYIARIISEKAKLNTVLNLDERNKMAVQFATKHAQDISQVLADPEFNTEENKDQVAKLNESFDQEIKTVKSKISYLIPKKNIPEEPILATTSEEVVIAGSGKETVGLEVLEVKGAENKTTSSEATSSEATSSEVKSEIKIEEFKSEEMIIDEAKVLFDNKNYDEASEKLSEVNNSLSK